MSKELFNIKSEDGSSEEHIKTSRFGEKDLKLDKTNRQVLYKKIEEMPKVMKIKFEEKKSDKQKK